MAKGLVLQSVKAISKADIPALSKGGFVSSLKEFQDVRIIAAAVKREGASPAEAWDVVDFDKLAKENRDAAKMKTLVASFVQACRRTLKEFQVDKKLELRQRKNRLFLVSTE